MITVWKDKVIYFRHAFYGSALIVGTVLGKIIFGIPSWVPIVSCIVGSLLILSSAVVTYTVNRFPGEFKDYIGDIEELKLAKRVKDLGRSRLK